MSDEQSLRVTPPGAKGRIMVGGVSLDIEGCVFRASEPIGPGSGFTVPNPEHATFLHKVETIANGIGASSDPTYLGVGKLLHRVAEEIGYLGATSWQDYYDRREAALDADLQRIADRKRSEFGNNVPIDRPDFYW